MCPAGVQGRGGASGPLRRAGEAVGIGQRAGRERGTARTGKLCLLGSMQHNMMECLPYLRHFAGRCGC